MPANVPKDKDYRGWGYLYKLTDKQHRTIRMYMDRVGVDEATVGEWCGDGFTGIQHLSKRAASWVILRLSVLFKAHCERDGRIDLWERA